MLGEIFGLDSVVVVIVAVVVLFGGSQIPKLARSLGSAHKEFRHGQREGAESVTPPEPAATATLATVPEGDAAKAG